VAHALITEAVEWQTADRFRFSSPTLLFFRLSGNF